jgi:hypothetical protein
MKCFFLHETVENHFRSDVEHHPEFFLGTNNQKSQIKNPFNELLDSPDQSQS